MKPYTLLLVFLLLFSNSYAQSPLWAKLIEDIPDYMVYTEGTNVAVDVYGNSYALGSGNISDTSTGAMLAKYNSSGNLVWQKIIQCSNSFFDIQTGGLAVDDIGNVYIAGVFNGDSIILDNDTVRKFNAGAINGLNYFIFKLDSSGNVGYHKNGGSCYYATTLALDKLGNLYFFGCFNSDTITFGSYTLTNESTAPDSIKDDLFLVKYNRAGNIVWAESMKGNGDDLPSAITISDSGYLYLTGTTTSSDLKIGGNILDNVGDISVFVAKYDVDGNPLRSWLAARYTGEYPTWELITGITTDLNENVYISGSFFINFTVGNKTFTTPPYDAFGIPISAGYFAKFSSTGNFLWAKRFGGANVDQAYEIVYDYNSGNIVLNGGIGSPSISVGGLTLNRTNTYEYEGFSDQSFIVECDTNGNAICGNVYNYGGEDILSLAIDNEGFMYIAGDAMNGVCFGSETASDTPCVQAEESLFIAKIDRCPGTINTSVVKSIEKDNQIIISPNPATETVTITYQGTINGEANIRLYSVTGQSVYNCPMNSGNTIIPVSGLSSGVYFCKITWNGQVVTKKVVVQ